jgi:hypothetical protein
MGVTDVCGIGMLWEMTGRISLCLRKGLYNLGTSVCCTPCSPLTPLFNAAAPPPPPPSRKESLLLQQLQQPPAWYNAAESCRNLLVIQWTVSVALGCKFVRCGKNWNEVLMVATFVAKLKTRLWQRLWWSLSGVRRSVLCFCVWKETGFSRREDVFTFNLLYKEF